MHAILVVLVLGAALYTEGAAANLIDCAQIENRWRNTTAGTSFDEWATLYDDALYNSDCDGRIVAEIGLDVIERELPAVRSAYRSSFGDGTFGALRGRLDGLREYGSHLGSFVPARRSGTAAEGCRRSAASLPGGAGDSRRRGAHTDPAPPGRYPGCCAIAWTRPQSSRLSFRLRT